MKLTKHLKNIFVIILVIVLIKWIILFIPSFKKYSQIPLDTKVSLKNYPEITLTLNFKELKPKIDKKFHQAILDIKQYRDKKLLYYKKKSHHRLELNFLDWLFSYSTGYMILLHKIGAWLGISSDEVAYIKENFEKRVIQKQQLILVINDINSYTQNRLKDLYQDIFITLQSFINNKIKALKLQGVSNIIINNKDIPYAKYISSSIVDGYFIYKGFSETKLLSFLGAKVAISKIPSLVGAKVSSVLGAKVATLATSKIGALFFDIATLGLGFLIDFGINEGIKQIQWDETRKKFKKVLDQYLTNLTKNIENIQNRQLYEIKKSIMKEINKQSTIKGI